MRQGPRTTIFQWILWLVGGGLQGVWWLYTTIAGIGVTAVFGLAVCYLRDMPSLQFWLLVIFVFILVFAVFNHITASVIRRREQGAPTPGTPTIGHANNVYFSTSPTTQSEPETQDDRGRRRIEDLRNFFDNFDYDDKGNVLVTKEYRAIRPHLKPEILDCLENKTKLHLEPNPTGESDLRIRGKTPSSVKELLLDEVTRLKREGGVV